VKRKINWLILPVTILLSTCQLFLGSDPDTDPAEILKSLWNDFNNIHANLDFRMSTNTTYNSWYDVYYNKQNGYAKRVYPDMSEDALFNVCVSMLSQLNDPHVGLRAPGKYSYSSISDVFDIRKVRNELREKGYDTYKNFIYGTFIENPDIGYIYIEKFMDEDPDTENQEWGRAIDKIVNSLANTKALVLDVRSNRGGDIYVMEYIASYFASVKKDYIKARVKTGPRANDLSAPVIYTLKSVKSASNNAHGYTKPIVLLTNGDTVSAAEWFTMALRTQKHITHAGRTTCGAFSARNDRFMINGWIYSISPERVTDMNDKYYEGIGIPPEILLDRNESNKEDKQLKDAIKLLEGEYDENQRL